jgi:hypothetical protein
MSRPRQGVDPSACVGACRLAFLGETSEVPRVFCPGKGIGKRTDTTEDTWISAFDYLVLRFAFR